MIFKNSQLQLSELPAIKDVEFQRLAPAYRTVEYIGAALVSGFLFAGWLVFFFVNPLNWAWLNWGTLALWASLFGLSMYVAGRRYDCAGYALRERDILHKHGVWWRTTTSIPFNRIQHVEVSQGLVENAFNLASLRVFTAGGSSSDLSIEGLLHNDAMRIKEFITQKIGENNGELEIEN
ncbi:MAG: PH domain-containing protein [Saprospiraceae bacterium]